MLVYWFIEFPVKSAIQWKHFLCVTIMQETYTVFNNNYRKGSINRYNIESRTYSGFMVNFFTSAPGDLLGGGKFVFSSDYLFFTQPPPGGIYEQSNPEVPNPRVADQYRSVGHLVPGRTERINNLHCFRFIYYLSLNDVLFWNKNSLCYIRRWLTLDACQDACLGHVIRYR